MGQRTEPHSDDVSPDAAPDGADGHDADVVALLPSTWTVDIEASGDPSDPAVDRDALRRLLDVLRGRHPSVGCTTWSYSVRFTVDASDDAVGAIGRAVDLWHDAVAEAGLPDWPVRRCELHRR